MPKKTDAWMPLWIGAYLADTQHLTRDEHGAYLLLLMAYWRNQGPLPDDDKRLAAIAKASTSEWRRLRPVLAEFFDIAKGHWAQKRADDELAAAGLRKEKATSRAKKAAQARWKNDNKDGFSDAPSNATSIPHALHDDMHEECPTPSPIKDKKTTPQPPKGGKEDKPRRNRPPQEPTPEFLAAWKLYPEREGGNSRADASKAWAARIRAGDATPQEMTDGVRRYAAFCKAKGKVGTQYVKRASTFFGPGGHYREAYDLRVDDSGNRIDLGGGRYRENGRIYGADGRPEVVL